MGLDLEFDVISNSCEVGFSKPHPKVYEFALDRLGVTGSESYFVGHTQKELDGASAVSMTTIRIDNAETDATHSDITLKAFEQLLALER